MIALAVLASGCEKSTELNESVDRVSLASTTADASQSVIVKTIAGEPDFWYAEGIAGGPDGSIYVVESDPSNPKVKKISCTGVITTLYQDNRETADLLDKIAVNKNGEIFVTSNGTFFGIYKIANGKATVLAGSNSNSAPFTDGIGSQARFAHINGIVVGPDDNLYVVDGSPNNRIRKITKDGVVTTIAGPGPYITLTIKKDGTIYTLESVYDSKTQTRGHAIRKISNGVVSTIAIGNEGHLDGKSPNVKFGRVMDLTIADDGNIYIAEDDDGRIRKVTEDGVVTTIAGGESEILGESKDGSGLDARFFALRSIRFHQGSLYTSEWGRKNIRKIDFK